MGVAVYGLVASVVLSFFNIEFVPLNFWVRVTIILAVFSSGLVSLKFLPPDYMKEYVGKIMPSK